MKLKSLKVMKWKDDSGVVDNGVDSGSVHACQGKGIVGMTK